MNQLTEASYKYPRLSVTPAEYKRLAGEVLETTRLYIERLSSLAAVARTLRKGIALNHCDRQDQMVLAELLERTAHQYECEAKAERQMMTVVMHDAEEAESNALLRKKGQGEARPRAKTRVRTGVKAALPA